MTSHKYDELLTRLDRFAFSPFENTATLCIEARAAIRELTEQLEAERKAREEAERLRIEEYNKRMEQINLTGATKAKLAAVGEWATDLLVYLNIEAESLPGAEYKIYEKSYDKTVAGLQAALNQSVAATTTTTVQAPGGVMPYPAVRTDTAPIIHNKSQYKRLVTQGASKHAAPGGGQSYTKTGSQESPASEHLASAAHEDTLHYTESGRAYRASDAVKYIRHCSEDGSPCPLPLEGKGRGDSHCEQNGICQRIDMNKLPTLKIELAAAPIKSDLPDCNYQIDGWCHDTKCMREGRCKLNAAAPYLHDKESSLREVEVSKTMSNVTAFLGGLDQAVKICEEEQAIIHSIFGIGINGEALGIVKGYESAIKAINNEINRRRNEF